MTFTYRLTPAWMNPPSPSPPPSPPEPRWWDRSGVVKGREEDLGSSVLLWILLAIPALLLLHCCLVRGCFCYDDVESPRRTRGRLRARRRRLRRDDDDDDDDPEDPDDSDVSDGDSVEPVSPAAWDGPTRSHRSGALAPFDARAAHPATFTDDNIHAWRALAMERARARAGAPTRPSPLRPTNGGTTRQARTRSHPNGHRRVSPRSRSENELADLSNPDEDDDREPGPMSGRAMATLPRCFVGDARWRGLRGLAPVGQSNEGVEQGAAATTTDAAAAAAAEAFEDVEMCLVCTDDCEPGDELIVLTCHHSFHADCIKRWLKVNAVCPACRARVTRVSGRERAALWRSRWGLDDEGDWGGDGVGDRGGEGEEIVVNVVG